jgi:mRNA interferase HigB
MRIIAQSTLAGFCEKHPDAGASLEHWSLVVKAADWANSNDVQATFPKAKVLNGERVRFEVSGGDYRLIAAFKFKSRLCFIKFLGTHAEYDRIDALTVSQF